MSTMTWDLVSTMTSSEMSKGDHDRTEEWIGLRMTNAGSEHSLSTNPPTRQPPEPTPANVRMKGTRRHMPDDHVDAARHLSHPATGLARPTMKDVASITGVSAKTVSRVVNGDSRVSPETHRRVTDAIESLGFRRNEYARQLRQRTATTIGLVLNDLADPFFATMARAIEDVALQHGHMLLASSSAEDSRRAATAIESFSARGVTSVIMSAPAGIDIDLLRSEVATGSTIVLVDRPIPDLRIDTVLVDNAGGASRATRHLLDHGHRRIAFFGDAESVYTANERRNGYEIALVEAGIEVDQALIHMAQPHSVGLQSVLEQMLSLPEPPTAFFAGNNRWSVQLLRNFPDSLESTAFIGFDDFELADLLVPGRTVMSQDPAEIGRIAARLLFKRILGDVAPPELVLLEAELIRRGSGELPPA